MPQKETQVAVIGGGPGGYMAAIRAAQLGAQVTLIEADRLGGTCVNRGCVPTKALLQAVSYLDGIKKAAAYGISAGKVAVDFKKMMVQKDQAVKTLVLAIRRLVRGNGIQLLEGYAKLASHQEVAVGGADGKTRMVRADRIILAMGSRTASLPVPGIESAGVITSQEALQLDSPPESLLIIGGGYIGLEFATIYSRLGSRVTIVEKMPAILPLEEEETAGLLAAALESEGIRLKTGAEVERILPSGASGKLKVHIKASKPETITADKVLAAVGRVPMVDEAVLKNSDIKRSPKGIQVDDRLRTSVPNIFAIGDVVGGHLLAHVAYAEAAVAAENAMGRDSVMDYDVIPRCAYTLPELASVGMSEKQARLAYPQVRVGKFHFRFNGRALISGDQIGLVKILSEPRHGEILGVHILGPHATELIAEASAVMKLEGTVDELVSIIHAHPTLTEAVGEAGLDLLGRAVHLPAKS
jgi:dihydrolipoamide dehydrogenase